MHAQGLQAEELMEHDTCVFSSFSNFFLIFLESMGTPPSDLEYQA